MSNIFLRALLLFSSAIGAIPEPPVLLWGSVQVNGQAVTATDDVRVYARVPEAVGEVGWYQMGSNGNAANLYILQIHLESLADGTAQSADRAIVGQTAQIFVDGSDVPNGPILVANFQICEMGQVRQVDLPGLIPGVSGDMNHDCAVTIDDIAPFVSVLIGVDLDPSNIATADMDMTGTADGQDIRPFVDAILSGN